MKRDYYWEVSFHKEFHEPHCVVWKLETEKFADGFLAQQRYEQIKKEGDYRARAQIKFVNKEDRNVG